jgi:hypothetical protein
VSRIESGTETGIHHPRDVHPEGLQFPTAQSVCVALRVEADDRQETQGLLAVTSDGGLRRALFGDRIPAPRVVEAAGALSVTG